jgi:GT2 family glycosyltransferase
MIYGCGNCLIKRRVFETLGSPAFDLRFNFLGGGDTDFFFRCQRNGMTFYWTEEAVIVETVPDVRTRASWIVLRGLRIGAINYHVQRKVALSPWLRLKLTAKMLALVPLSFVRAFWLVLSDRTPLVATHPMLVAVGSLLAAIGIEPQPYKASKIAS